MFLLFALKYRSLQHIHSLTRKTHTKTIETICKRAADEPVDEWMNAHNSSALKLWFLYPAAINKIIKRLLSCKGYTLLQVINNHSLAFMKTNKTVFSCKSAIVKIWWLTCNTLNCAKAVKAPGIFITQDSVGGGWAYPTVSAASRHSAA